jgi:hypothetical protein
LENSEQRGGVIDLMIGGKVIESRAEGEKTRLWVMDHRQTSDELLVYVETQAEMPQPGDDVWWQAGFVYWTPADHRFVDQRIPRIGYSFSPREY